MKRVIVATKLTPVRTGEEAVTRDDIETKNVMKARVSGHNPLTQHPSFLQPTYVCPGGD